MKTKHDRRKIRKIRIKGGMNIGKLPRLTVYRSSKHIYAQLIDDAKKTTIISVHEKEIKASSDKTKTDLARELGVMLAEKAAEKKIKTAVFDRNGFRYHGRVRALAEGAREKGLKF